MKNEVELSVLHDKSKLTLQTEMETIETQGGQYNSKWKELLVNLFGCYMQKMESYFVKRKNSF